MFNRQQRFWGPWQQSPFQKGDLKYIVLDLIKDKPRYGYEIIRVLEERSHGFYAPSPGTVYPTLQLLEEMGYVVGVQDDGKKVYSITDEGRRFLEEREHSAEGVKKRMTDSWGALNTAEVRQTMAEFGRLGRLIGGRVRRADAERMRRVREVISGAYKDIEGILED